MKINLEDILDKKAYNDVKIGEKFTTFKSKYHHNFFDLSEEIPHIKIVKMDSVEYTFYNNFLLFFMINCSRFNVDFFMENNIIDLNSSVNKLKELLITKNVSYVEYEIGNQLNIKTTNNITFIYLTSSNQVNLETIVIE